MKHVHAFIFAFLFACSPALAQWQTPDRSVPIGRGGGATGFRSAAPGTAGLPFVSNGPAAADPAFQALTNSGLAPAPANSVKCNPTGVSGPVQDCTTVPSSTLPPPGPTTLGGVRSKDCSPGGQFLQKINTDGTETCATPPAPATISGTYNVLSSGLVNDYINGADGACNSNTTFSTTTATFSPSDVGKSIAIGGCGAAGATLVTSIVAYVNATTVTLNNAASVTTSGQFFQFGTNNTTPLNALITAANPGSTFIFPPGNYFFVGIVTVNKASLSFIGAAPEASPAAIAGSGLFFGNNNSDQFFDVVGVSYTLFRNLTVRSLVPEWSGYLTVVRNGGVTDPANTIFDRMDFHALSNGSGLLLNTSIEVAVLDSRFTGGLYGINGALLGGYANVFRMTGGQFIGQTGAPVRTGGNSWVFNNVTFEQRADNRLIVFLGSPAIPIVGLTFTNCWMGDAFVPLVGPAIDVYGQGFVFTGNLMAGGGGASETAIALNNVKGFSITGNTFYFYGNGIDYATATVQGGLLSGNGRTSVTTWEANTGNKDASVINTGNIAF